MNHTENLLAALQSHAPNAVAVYVCKVMVDTARTNGHVDIQIQLMLAEALADGLRHGNWPWNNHESFVRAMSI